MSTDSKVLGAGIALLTAAGVLIGTGLYVARQPGPLPLSPNYFVEVEADLSEDGVKADSEALGRAEQALGRAEKAVASVEKAGGDYAGADAKLAALTVQARQVDAANLRAKAVARAAQLGNATPRCCGKDGRCFWRVQGSFQPRLEAAGYRHVKPDDLDVLRCLCCSGFAGEALDFSGDCEGIKCSIP